MSRQPAAVPSLNGTEENGVEENGVAENAQPRVAILLSSYNGEQYLRAQLDSLLAQTWRNFVIVARDDGSTDGSAAIIREYAAQHAPLFHLLSADGRNLGASASFSYLMAYALREKQALGLDKAYLMLCDQDDVWYPHKITRSMHTMNVLEAQRAGVPVLVHSDLKVVDRNRSLIASSFMAYQGLDPYRRTLGRMVVSNIVTGCTGLFNEELASLASPVPSSAIMHDWWLALVAAAFGRIGYVEEPLLDYRQHEGNTIGARAYRKAEGFRERLARLMDNQHDQTFRKTAVQAGAFLAVYRSRLRLSQRLVLQLASTLLARGVLVQKLTLKLLQHL